MRENKIEDKALICEVLKNLREYNYELKCDTKQAVFSFLGSQLASDKIKESCASVFNFLDKNRDGKITKIELKQNFLHYLGEAPT